MARHLVVLLNILALSTFLPASAEQNTPPPDVPLQSEPIETIKAESNLVVLDLVVRDKQGRSVTGLKREDFTVFEDAKPQTLRSFEATDAAGPVPDTPKLDDAGNLDWGSAPLTILVIDELTTSFESMAYARFELEKYLKRQPALLDTPAKLLAVNDKGFQEIAPYTRDRDLLLERLQDRSVGLPSALFRGDLGKLIEGTFTTLKQIALASEGEKDERKNLIWIGTGFPAVPYYQLGDRSRAVVEAVIRDTTTSLLHARIVVYQIDPEGLGVQQPFLVAGGGRGLFTAIGTNGPGARAIADEVTLSTFASQTGGRYLFNRNDVDVAVGDSIADLQHSYAISYSPVNLVHDDKYRTIRVKVNRPGLTVQTRDGYFAPGAHTVALPLHESEYELARAASNSMYYSGIRARIASIKPSKTPGTVDIMIRVEAKDLRWEEQADGKMQSTLLVAAVAQSSARKMLTSHVMRFVFAMPDAKPGEAPPSDLMVATNLPLLEKAPYLRILIRDSSGRVGSADVDPAVISSLQTQMARDHSKSTQVR